MKTINYLIIVICIISITNSYSQVGIGTTSPEASSVLDIVSIDKGLLIPRVGLVNISTTMIDGVNTAATGLLIYNTNASVIGGNGVGYYYFNGTIWEQISTSATSNDHDWYEEGTTNAPNDINDNMFTQGNVAIGKIIADYALDVEESSDTLALNVAMVNSSNANNYSAYFENLSTGTGEHYGIKTSVSGSDKVYGNYNDLSSSGNTFEMYGVYNNITGDFLNTGTKYGLYNNFENYPASSCIGIQNEMTQRESYFKKGIINNVISDGLSFGVENNITGGGFAVGTSNNVYGGFTASTTIGTRNDISGISIATGYASYNTIHPSYLGPQIGVYSEVTRQGGYSYAGYFRGRLAVGTTVFNSSVVDSYVFPASRGIANQIMQTDGSGNVSWVDTSIAISHSINDLLDGKSDNDGTQDGSSIFLGIEAGQNDDSSNNRNVGIGYQSLSHIESGYNNTALGHNSLYWNTTGNNNIAIGSSSGRNNGGNNNMFFGNDSGYFETGNNKLYIENSNANADSSLIYGEFDNNILRINGELQLGDSVANRYALPLADGTANQIIQTDGSGRLNWVDETPIRNTSNGLSINANDVVLGGTLTQATTITQDTHDIIYDLNSSGDFRIEGNNEPNLFYADGGNDRIGILTNTPSFDIHLVQPDTFVAGSSGMGFSVGANNWKIYHSGLHFSFVENGVRRAYITGGTGVYVVTSDRRLKKNITEVESILDRVNTLKTYRYLYNDQDISAKKTIGFMAQDVQSLFPELVEIREDSFLGLNYSGFAVVAIKAIQEQQNIIDTQQKQIEALQNAEVETTKLLNSLLKRIENLESQD